MEVQEIANKLREYCLKGDFESAQKDLYADDVISLEPEGTPGGHLVVGLEAVLAKGEEWNNMVEEVHNIEVSEPLVADRFFALKMSVEATFKEGGRQQMDELCVYEVEDDKIVKEEFFYTPAPTPQAS